MKSKLKALVSFCMTLCICCVMSATAFAAELPAESVINETETTVSETIQPRIGIAGYRNYYHNGNTYYGKYTISTKSIAIPMKQITVQRSNFNNDTSIVIGVFNSNGQRVMDDMWFTGNGKRENIPMTVPGAFINGGTYTIKYNIYHGGTTPLSGDDGWIGIWIF